MQAQTWLDQNYPQEKRINIKKLDISNKNLEGPLNLDGFNNLEKLDCSGNLITKLDLTSCEKLIKLILGDNDFDEQDLTCFSHLTNLEKLYLGTSSEKRVKQGFYNRFNGSLEPLKNLVELKELAISNTDIDEGLEYLPDTLEKLYCFNYRGDKIGCEKIRKELRGCFNKSKQYYDLRVQKPKVSIGSLSSSSSCSSSVAGDTKLQEQIREKDKMIEDLRKESHQLIKYKYKELLNIRKKIDDDEISDRLSKQEFKKLIKQKETLEKELKEFQDKNVRNILIIGRTGSGRSTLANVISGIDKFKESTSSISETHRVQAEEFEENEIKYRVIDTFGIGDTRLTEQKALEQIAELFYS